MTMQLNSTKPGEQAPIFSLNLSKPARFSIELYWESEHDLDGHVFLTASTGSAKAILSSWNHVLSTYNPELILSDGSGNKRPSGDKRPFMTPCQSLKHSGDSRNGIGATLDEVIKIDGSCIPAGLNELPIFVTLHNQDTTFSSVEKAGIRIKDEHGKVLQEFHLSNQFAQFNAVQMGALLLSQSGWEFHAVGAGIKGDFNNILKNYS